MNRIGTIVLLLLAALMVLGQEGIRPSQLSAEIEREHAKWIDSVITSIRTVKAGATRKDLLKVFTEEGGFYQRNHTFAYKGCPYVKVDVEFAPAERENNGLTEKPEDKISAISRPYLEYPTTD
jgi:hypothetical protein